MILLHSLQRFNITNTYQDQYHPDVIQRSSIPWPWRTQRIWTPSPERTWTTWPQCSWTTCLRWTYLKRKPWPYPIQKPKSPLQLSGKPIVNRRELWKSTVISLIITQPLFYIPKHQSQRKEG